MSSYIRPFIPFYFGFKERAVNSWKVIICCYWIMLHSSLDQSGLGLLKAARFPCSTPASVLCFSTNHYSCWCQHTCLCTPLFLNSASLLLANSLSRSIACWLGFQRNQSQLLCVNRSQLVHSGRLRRLLKGARSVQKLIPRPFLGPVSAETGSMSSRLKMLVLFCGGITTPLVWMHYWSVPCCAVELGYLTKSGSEMIVWWDSPNITFENASACVTVTGAVCGAHLVNKICWYHSYSYCNM